MDSIYPLHCAAIINGKQCDQFLGGVFDGQGDYCASCHWHVKQSNPAYQKLCANYLHDPALNAIGGLILDAHNQLDKAILCKDPMPVQKVLRAAYNALGELYEKEKVLARERQHPGILAYEEKRKPFLEAAIEKSREAYLASKN